VNGELPFRSKLRQSAAMLRAIPQGESGTLCLVCTDPGIEGAYLPSAALDPEGPGQIVRLQFLMGPESLSREIAGSYEAAHFRKLGLHAPLVDRPHAQKNPLPGG
jgi:hypothetical protein